MSNNKTGYVPVPLTKASLFSDPTKGRSAVIPAKPKTLAVARPVAPAPAISTTRKSKSRKAKDARVKREIEQGSKDLARAMGSLKRAGSEIVETLKRPEPRPRGEVFHRYFDKPDSSLVRVTDDVECPVCYEKGYDNPKDCPYCQDGIDVLGNAFDEPTDLDLIAKATKIRRPGTQNLHAIVAAPVASHQGQTFAEFLSEPSAQGLDEPINEFPQPCPKCDQEEGAFVRRNAGTTLEVVLCRKCGVAIHPKYFERVNDPNVAAEIYQWVKLITTPREDRPVAVTLQEQDEDALFRIFEYEGIDWVLLRLAEFCDDRANVLESQANNGGAEAKLLESGSYRRDAKLLRGLEIENI